MGYDMIILKLGRKLTKSDIRISSITENDRARVCHQIEAVFETAKPEGGSSRNTTSLNRTECSWSSGDTLLISSLPPQFPSVVAAVLDFSTPIGYSEIRQDVRAKSVPRDRKSPMLLPDFGFSRGFSRGLISGFTSPFTARFSAPDARARAAGVTGDFFRRYGVHTIW